MPFKYHKVWLPFLLCLIESPAWEAPVLKLGGNPVTSQAQTKYIVYRLRWQLDFTAFMASLLFNLSFLCNEWTQHFRWSKQQATCKRWRLKFYTFSQVQSWWADPESDSEKDCPQGNPSFLTGLKCQLHWSGGQTTGDSVDAFCLNPPNPSMSLLNV